MSRTICNSIFMFLLHQITCLRKINWIELELELAVLGNCDVRISFTFVVIVMSVHNSLLLRWLWCQVSVDQSRWNHSYLFKKKRQLLFLHLKRNIYRKLITYFLSTQSISLIVSPKYSDRNNILDQHKIGLSTRVSRNIEIP